MIPPFNVLDRHTAIHRHYVLEASAGTGKTFSIQHIVARLLIESGSVGDPLTLQNILVVTFTRAAVRDLKARIRATIAQSLKFLLMQPNQDQAELPDYLYSFMQQGEEAIQKACKRLQQALFAFDQAQIFTIHSFCARTLRQFALESDVGLQAFYGEEPLPLSEIMGVIRNFMRTEVHAETYSPNQLAILLAHDPDQKKLLKLIQSSHDFPALRPFHEIYGAAAASIKQLKARHGLSADRMIADFRAQAPFYRNHKGALSKAATLSAVLRFARLFDLDSCSPAEVDELIRDGVVWVKALDPELLKGTPPPPAALHYPDLTAHLATSLHLLIEEARHFSTLLARMAADCRRLLQRYQQEEEKFSPDDMLRKMDQALDHPRFLAQVQACYQAAIIDEFQDTDPLQWQIFRRLFIPQSQDWPGYLYLVGDPKQSIYSFRQADIYTYLTAAKTLGAARCFSLAVNYRAQPQLVAALNALFAAERLPHFMPLPKQASHLPYCEVQASGLIEAETGKRAKGVLHFCIADGKAFKKFKLEEFEERVFFPFIATEIRLLMEHHRWTYRQFAILVRDRRQALRLAAYFDHLGLPYLNQRGKSLAESPALQALIDLMRAVLHPHERSAMGAVAGSLLMGWTHAEIQQPAGLAFISLFLQRLRAVLVKEGFASFFESMLQASCKPEGPTVQEQLLAREGGLEWYRDLRQIADKVIDHQYLEWQGNEGIIPFLDRFRVWDENEDERVKCFQDSTADGVNILTLHFSKGLEFEVVFALGLVNRTDWKEVLVPIERHDRWCMSPVVEHSEEYQGYCEEHDAEKMRQLYVACTRAKYQLYVPAILDPPAQDLQPGEASPMELLLARFNQPAESSSRALYARIQAGSGQHLVDFLDAEGERWGMTYALHREIAAPLPAKTSPPPLRPLSAPQPVVVTAPVWWLTSFSLLNAARDHHPIEPLNPPCDFDCPVKNIHTLPANSETGVLMHRLLEKISFGAGAAWAHSTQALPLVTPLVAPSPFKGWEPVIADLVFRALTTPILPDGFCLAQLEESQLSREMPFVFPYSKAENIPGLEAQEGLIRGVIDLLFCWQGTYYLVDWKSNWLGDSCESYTIPCLERVMHAQGYVLQASLYVAAIKRYLRLIDPRPFEECFGGVLYLFLRGLQRNADTGIYLLPATFTQSTTPSRQAHVAT